MPPSLALLLTIIVALALVIRESARNTDASSALWLPVLWLAITGSRFVSQWIGLGGGPAVASDSEGSSIDAIYFGALILVGVVVLMRRNIAFGDLFRSNIWLLLFLAYGLISVAWSDFPFIAFKRWTKTMGHPVMALIILTDPQPVRALKIVLKRCSFLLLPFSVVLIKYFPEYGRSFDPYFGMPTNNGVGLTKNGLGHISMVAGLFFVWQLFDRGSDELRKPNSGENLISICMLVAVVWLLQKADSATSILALALGSLTMLLIYTGVVGGRALTAMLVLGILFGWLADYLFSVYEQILLLVGRDPTLTDRTLLWQDVIALQENPYLGTGFESFWLGPRMEVLAEKWWWLPNQAHNGYIETYLNLGYVGLLLLIATILSAYSKIQEGFLIGSELAPFWLALLVAIILFNFTESGFKGVHFMWTLFYIIAIEYQPAAALAYEWDDDEAGDLQDARHAVGRQE